jgi:hypothetical protein
LSTPSRTASVWRLPWQLDCIRATTNRCRHTRHARFGTTLGPHVVRYGERSAHRCTSCRAKNCHLTLPTSGNELAQFSGVQVVAGSNPVSPTLSARPRVGAEPVSERSGTAFLHTGPGMDGKTDGNGIPTTANVHTGIS